MRVLHVVCCLSTGGAETFLMNLLRYDQNKTIQFDFLQITQDEGFYEKEALLLGSKIFKIHPHRSIGTKGMIKETMCILKNNNYDVVHSHVDYLSGPIMKAAKLCGIRKRIAHCHSTSFALCKKFPYNLGFLYYKYLINKNANGYLACGEAAKFWLFNKTKSVKVINNVIDINKFSNPVFDKDSLIEELRIRNMLVLGHVGRFVEEKNHFQLLRIFKNFLNQKPNSVLLLCGIGQLQEQVIDYAKKIGIYSNCRFLGARSDINYLMNIMDLFLMPSLFEGFPMTLIEAQAANLKSIVSINVSKDVDLGLGLIEFTELSDNWNEIIFSTLIKDKTNIENCIERLKEKGFSQESSFNKILEIYQDKL